MMNVLSKPLLLLLLAIIVLHSVVSMAQEGHAQVNDSETSSIQGYLDDVMVQLHTTTSEEEKALLYSDIGFIYKMMGDLDEGLAYVDSGLALSERLNFYNGASRAHEHLGSIFLTQGKLSRSLFHTRKELGLILTNNDSLGSASVYYHIGLALQKLGRSSHALDTLAIATKMLRTASDSPLLASCIYEMSSIHYDLGNPEQALININEALPLLDSKMQIRNRPMMLAGKSRMLIKLDRLDEAEDVLLEAQGSCQELNLEIELGHVLIVLGELKNAQGKSSEVIEILDQALNIVKEKEQYNQIISIHLEKSIAYFQLGQLENACQSAEEGLTNLDRNELIRTEVGLYAQLARLYEAKGEMDKAHEFLKKYQDAENLRMEKADLVQTRHLEAKYRNERQKVIILEKNKVISEKEQELKSSSQRNRTIWITLIGLVLLVLISSFALIQRHHNRRQIAQIEMDKALIESTEEERERIARDLHDGTGSLLTGIKLSLDRLHLTLPESEDKDGLKYTISQVLQLSKEVRRVSHAMAPSTIDRMDYQDVLDDLVRTFALVGTASVHPSFSGDLEGMDKAQRLMLYRILQECLNNTFKHAAATEINISINVTPTEVEMLYEDNGRGYDQDSYTKGLGLQSIAQRIRYLKGRKRIDTSPGEGMTLILSFPLDIT